MKKRRKKLLNKHVQLPLILKLMAIFIIVFLITAMGLGAYLEKNSKEIKQTTIELKKNIAHEKEVLNTLLKLSQKNGGKIAKAKIVKLQTEHKTYLEKLNTHLANLEKQNHQTYKVLFAFIGWLVLAMILLFFAMLDITHKIVGPIFLLKKTLRDFKQGKVVERRNLRKKDYFQDIYHDLFDVIEKAVKKKQL